MELEHGLAFEYTIRFEFEWQVWEYDVVLSDSEIVNHSWAPKRNIHS